MENIPFVLRQLRRWVVWAWQWSSGRKVHKPLPLQASGKNAKCSDSNTWCSFEDAIGAAKSGRFDGVGFMLGKDTGVVGIDLDDCRDAETGQVFEPAQSIIGKFASYAEVSPSGRG